MNQGDEIPSQILVIAGKDFGKVWETGLLYEAAEVWPGLLRCIARKKGRTGGSMERRRVVNVADSQAGDWTRFYVTLESRQSRVRPDATSYSKSRAAKAVLHSHSAAGVDQMNRT